jgi:hypothetical protein
MRGVLMSRAFRQAKRLLPLRWATLEAATLTLGEASPDSKTLIMGERVFETLLADLTGEADSLRLASGATLLWKEGLWIGLRTE